MSLVCRGTRRTRYSTTPARWRASLRCPYTRSIIPVPLCPTSRATVNAATGFARSNVWMRVEMYVCRKMMVRRRACIA